MNMDEAMTDSLTVAKYFGKQHSHVLRKIDQIVGNQSQMGRVDCPQKWGECFRRR